jgi:hypothetical protein
MTLTVYLAKVIGLGLIILGGAIMLRRDYFIPVFATFARERLTRIVLSFVELIAGLALIVGHNVWSPAPAAIISLLGWIAAIEATAYLLLPDEIIEKWVAVFNTPTWYLGGGLLSVVLGAYLAGFGFGLW